MSQPELYNSLFKSISEKDINFITGSCYRWYAEILEGQIPI